MSVIRQLHQQLVSKERSAVEITQDYLDRIAALEPKLHSYLTVTADQALAQARQVDAKIAAGDELGMLAGIPLAIKDNMCTKGIRTTCASKVLENFVPPYESTVTQKLMEAGAIALGKTNLDEFAMGSSTEKLCLSAHGQPLGCGASAGGVLLAVQPRQWQQMNAP